MAKMKVFISHTNMDKHVAERIGEDLLRYGVDVWLDKWDMFAGDSLYDRIEDGMREVDAFVILLSKASAVSSWIRDEIKIALTRRRRLDPNFRIVSILLERVDFPAFLSDLIYIDWSDRGSAPF